MDEKWIPAIRMAAPDTLKPHPKNPRVHSTEQLERLEKAIRRFGWTNPILIGNDGFILAGEARWKTAIKMGLSEVPVIDLPFGREDGRAYLVADNRLSEMAAWDARLLREILGGLDTDLYAATGFTPAEAEQVLKEYEAALTRGAVDPVIGGARGPREVLAGPREGRAPEPETSFLTFSVTEGQRHLIQTALNVAMNELSSQDQAQALSAVCKAYIEGQE